MLQKVVRHLIPFIPLFLCCAVCRSAPSPTVLANGFRVVVRERHSNALVAIDLWVHAGAREEQPGEEGAAHFLEHTLFKGTTTRGPGDADSAIEDLGATLNAATGPDCAHFYTTVATTHLHAALAILADVVRNATLPDREVERERGVILDELAQHASDPISALVDQLYASAFPDGLYGRSPGGTEAAIRIRGRDTLAQFYRRAYAPERCTLAFAGDITPETARGEADSAFGGWKSHRMPVNPQTAAASQSFSPHSSANGVAYAYLCGASSPCCVGIGFLAPPAHDLKMVCAAHLARALLGRYEGEGRLQRAALAGTAAEAYYSPRRDTSLLYVTATVDTVEKRPSVRAALRDAVRSLTVTPPTTEEWNAAKLRVIGNTRFDLETNGGLARAIGFADSVDGDTPEMFLAHLRELTRTEFRQFLETYLNPEKAVDGQFPPASAGKEASP